MKKRDYIVRFYYETDLRAEVTVWAYNETSALIQAMDQENIEKWMGERGFKIEILLKEDAI